MGGLFHAPIFHDRQSINNETPQQTSSDIFSNIAGAELTTKDLGENGNYSSSMPIIISSSLNNSVVSFRVLIDDVAAGSVRHIPIKVKDLNLGYTLTSNLGGSGIPPGSNIKIQWAVNQGTATLSCYSLMTDGIPGSRVEE